jgi:peptidoglycan/xylan/chitin deacetylase (PgdA/CDA1 family)
MRVPVIMYHKIDMLPRDALHHGPYTSPQRFTKQMAFLKKQGFIFYSASELITYFYENGRFPPRGLAITFDDGPDPRWTPQVLDILKAANVKAAFFVVGVNAERYPGLVRRIVNEGHEIGNHTYYHPNLALCWPEHIRLELNATQLLLETITGRATTLFRPPYAADSSPTQLSELTPLKIAEDLNYLIVLESIDPQDWAKPGADVILQRVKQQRRDGSIILLHDAGGDRSQTVEALPRILDWLHTRGDIVVPLSTLLGTTRDAVMPVVQYNGQSLTRLVSSAGFRVYHTIEEFLWAFMIVATALVVVRTLVVIWLAYRFRRGPKTNFAEPVSVVIAAYNEGKVIAETLRTLLATDYKGEIEVVIVNDGSRDETAAEVERVATSDSRVRLLQQENRGKARALQRGIHVLDVLDALGRQPLAKSARALLGVDGNAVLPRGAAAEHA